MEIRPHIEAFLREAIGLSAASIGPSGIDSAVRDRMRQHAVLNEHDYLSLLRASALEEEALIERIIVPETWFFRDAKPFEALQDYVLRTWRPTCVTRPLRILSIPCASGEEPYSIAMSLMDLGFSPEQWQLDARDVSNKALLKAKSGRYGRNSFRGPNLGFRSRYFVREGQEYLLNPAVRQSVHFAYGNLMGLSNSPNEFLYDLIFFRNLLIYLGEDDQRRALAAIFERLADNGLLFVGHADALRLLGRWFDSAGYPGAFAYRKKRTHGVTSTAVVPQPPGQRHAAFGASPGAPGPDRVTTRPGMPARAGAAVVQRAEELLSLARRCADSGSLDQAYAICQAVLQTGCCRAAAHHLQGVIHDARDDAVLAEESFRRALSLEPDHFETLVHSALIAERRGDLAAAARLRTRAQRAEARQRHAARLQDQAPTPDPGSR
jgi:chemotaxis protein methyltransferase WspC